MLSSERRPRATIRLEKAILPCDNTHTQTVVFVLSFPLLKHMRPGAQTAEIAWRSVYLVIRQKRSACYCVANVTT